jgi:hypothetical protein
MKNSAKFTSKRKCSVTFPTILLGTNFPNNMLYKMVDYKIQFSFILRCSHFRFMTLKKDVGKYNHLAEIVGFRR